MSTDNSGNVPVGNISTPPAAPLSAVDKAWDAQPHETKLAEREALLKANPKADVSAIDASIARAGGTIPDKEKADDYTAHGLKADQASPADYRPELGRGVDEGGRTRLNDLSASWNLGKQEGESLSSLIAETNSELGKIFERDGAAGWDAWKERMSAITERLVKTMPESVSHEELVTLAGKALERSNTDLANRLRATDIGQVMLRHPVILRTLAHIEISHQRLQSRYNPGSKK